MPMGDLTKGSQQFSLNLFSEAEQQPSSTKVAPSTTVSANPPTLAAKPGDLLKMFSDPMNASVTKAAAFALKKNSTTVEYKKSMRRA